MSRLHLFAAFLLLTLASAAYAQSAYDAVDPIIGTSGDGNTFPGASLPFGMVQWSPDTGDNGWYFYNQKKIYGFGMTHLSGAGCPLYGDAPILPLTGELTASPATALGDYAQSFDHAHEEAHPGYYSVTLANGIEVALTVTDRAGIARIRFPQGQSARLLVNSGGSANSDVHVETLPPVGREHDGNQIKVTGDNAVSGSTTSGGFCGSPTRYTLYFAAKFEQPFTSFSTWNGDAIQKNQREAAGKHTGAWLDFGNRSQIQLKIGISYVSEANALANLNKEIPGWNFDEVRANARSTWTKLLEQGFRRRRHTRPAKDLLHRPLPHAARAQSLQRRQRRLHRLRLEGALSQPQQHKAAQYANFSDWDIYRNTIQLQSLLVPKQVGDMMQSLVNDADQSGWLPRWPAANDVTYVMNGDSPAILLSSASCLRRAQLRREDRAQIHDQSRIRARQRPARRPRSVPTSPTTSSSATFPSKRTPAPPRAPSNTPATTSPSPSSPAASATRPTTRSSSSNPKTGRRSSIPKPAGFARRTPTAPGSRASTPTSRCPSAPTRPSPRTRTASKRATPTSTPS